MASILQPSLPFAPSRTVAQSIRRCVRRVRMAPDAEGTYTFRARSFTHQKGWSYRVRVNLRTGERSCTCRDFRFRRRFEGAMCKHLERALVTARLAERGR